MEQKHIVFITTNDFVTDQRIQRISNTFENHNFKTSFIGCAKTNILPNNTSYHTYYLNNPIIKKGILFYLFHNLFIFKTLISKQFDIIYHIDADTYLGVRLYNFFKTKPIIFDAHELFHEVPELEGKKIKKAIWKYCEKQSLKHALISITVSNSIFNYYLKLFNLKTTVIRNMPYFKPYLMLKKNENYIIYQGALNKGRGLEHLIAAMKSLNLKLWIVGKGDLDYELRSLVNKLDLESKVEFFGQIKPEQLHEITSKAWLGYNVLESIGMSYQFSLSNKTFDYIQAEIPQLFSPFPEYIALNNDLPFGIASSCNTDEIIRSIQNLIQNEMLYNELKNNCIKLKEKYSWENESLKLVDIIENQL